MYLKYLRERKIWNQGIAPSGKEWELVYKYDSGGGTYKIHDPETEEFHTFVTSSPRGYFVIGSV